VRDHEEEWLELCRQASVERDGDELMRLVSRINDLLDAKAKRLRAGLRNRAGNIKVFQIAYDERQLVARRELLRERGYEVSSTLGNEQAERFLERNQGYELFIVGHAAPSEVRAKMVRWLRANFPSSKILALNPPANPKLADVDYNFILNGPEPWLAVVASMGR